MTSTNDLPLRFPNETAAESATQESGLRAKPSVRSVLQRGRAHWATAVVVLVVGICATMVIARYRRPAYVSETVLKYGEGVNRELLGVEGGGDALKALPARLKEATMSSDRLEQLLHEYNLYPEIVSVEGIPAGLDRFRTKITFKARSAETFGISFEGSSAEEAQAVTMQLADRLIEGMAAERREVLAKTTAALQVQRASADVELSKRETELARFMADHPEFAAENGAGRPGAAVRTDTRRNAADPAMAALGRQVQRLRATLADKSGSAPGAVPGAPARPDPALVAAKNAADQDVIAATKDLEDKQSRLTDAYPDVKTARLRLTRLQETARKGSAALDAATAATGAPAAGEAPESPYRKASLTEDRAQQERELSAGERELRLLAAGVKPGTTGADADRIIALEIAWERGNRERDEARRRQLDIDARLFKARKNETSVDGGFDVELKVRDRAFLPVRTANLAKDRFIALGFLISLVAALAFAGVRGTFLDDRVFGGEDLADLAPVLGSIPAPRHRRAERQPTPSTHLGIGVGPSLAPSPDPIHPRPRPVTLS